MIIKKFNIKLRSAKSLHLSYYQCFVLQNITKIPTIYATGGMSPNDWENYVQESIESYDSDNIQNYGIYRQSLRARFNGQKASSHLSLKVKIITLENINDYNHKTAWVEGKSDYGIGEYFIVESIAINIIYNGYQKSKSSWVNNSESKNLKFFRTINLFVI